MPEDQTSQDVTTEQPINDVQPSIKDLPYDLDLDIMQPQPKKVKIGGSIYTVNPPKVSDIAKLYRIAGILENTKLVDAEQPSQDMIDAFKELIPGFIDDGKLTISQIWALFGFIANMANPVENSALKALNIEPTPEKKIPHVS